MRENITKQVANGEQHPLNNQVAYKEDVGTTLPMN